LVVVRSSLYDPLSASYPCICDLKEAADRQLNISGPRFHVYVFTIENDLSTRSVRHQSYEAQ